MNVSDKIIQLAKENNGVVTAAILSDKGILRGNLKKLVDEGKLEKTARGVYILPEIWEDEFVNLQARFKKGIFSNETALFLWDLTDRTPNKYDMTFPHNYNLTKVFWGVRKAAFIGAEWEDAFMVIGVVLRLILKGGFICQN